MALLTIVGLAVAAQGGSGTLFSAPLFSSGMILQRGAGTRIWGAGAAGPVTVTVKTAAGTLATAVSTAPAATGGAWSVSMPAVGAQNATTVTATDGKATETLVDVAWGEVLLCGGQSNMGFGMCGATVIPSGPHPQTPMEAMAALPTGPSAIRFFNQHGDHNGGAGSTVKGNVCNDPATTSNNGFTTWFKANATNSGAASAVCLLTAEQLYAQLGGGVPVGAVESCVGGTPVVDWTPPAGVLYKAHITPLLPFKFAAALWDQGEADEKRSNTTWYATEFPKMITGWRAAFESPMLPFVYVEICSENGADEPKEADFWEHGQRAALALPFVGFATTTDVDKSALHPPDKQDIAPRLAREVRRLALGEDVIARGPELVSSRYAAGALTLTFSNASMVIHKGVVVPPPASGCGNQTVSSAVRQVGPSGTSTAVPFEIKGADIVVRCTPGTEKQPVLINSDEGDCYVYGIASGLPAPPLSITCGPPGL